MNATVQVGVIYSFASPQSREGEYLAKYVGVCMAASGHCRKVNVIALEIQGNSKQNRKQNISLESLTTVIRSDHQVITGKQLGDYYAETKDYRVLADANVWILCTDNDKTVASLDFLQKRLLQESDQQTGKNISEKHKIQKKRIILSLQSTLRRFKTIEESCPKDILLQGGACFQITENQHGVLYPLSHGCYVLERLPKEKVDALFVVDLLEATGIQVLSRRNLSALKWGNSMVRLFYYFSALMETKSVMENLRDRNLRLVYLQALYEIYDLFNLITADDTAPAPVKVAGGPTKRVLDSGKWTPDTGGNAWLSVYYMMVFLPFPNWLFNSILLRILDFGLTESPSGSSVIYKDREQGLTTSFEDEYADLFDIAKHRNLKLPALELLRISLNANTIGDAGENLTLRSSALFSQLPSSSKSRTIAKNFILKVVGFSLIISIALIYVFLL